MYSARFEPIMQFSTTSATLLIEPPRHAGKAEEQNLICSIVHKFKAKKYVVL